MHIWVVEMLNEERGRWEPTVGVALSRAEGRRELRGWQERNDGRFTLVKYPQPAGQEE